MEHSKEFRVQGDVAVLLTCQLTASMDAVNTITYLDPEDGAEWDEADLSAVERGHTYLFVRQGATDRVEVHSPRRVFDLETVALIHQLPSFRVRAPLQRLHASAEVCVRSPACCIQDFSLSSAEFDIFAQRVAKLRGGPGEVIDDSVTLETYVAALRALEQEVLHVGEALIALRASQMAVDSVEAAEACLSSLADFKELRGALALSHGKVVRMSLRLVKESGGEHAGDAVGDMLGDIAAAAQQLYAVNYVREAKIIEDARRQAMGVKLGGLGFGTLRDELGLLRRNFPQLQHLSVTREGGVEVVSLTLAGLEIHMSPDKVWVTGDPEGIYRYTDARGVDISKAADASTGGSRFAGIRSFVNSASETKKGKDDND